MLVQGPIEPEKWASGEWLAATAEGDVIIWDAVADRTGKTHLAAGAERGLKCKWTDEAETRFRIQVQPSFRFIF